MPTTRTLLVVAAVYFLFIRKPAAGATSTTPAPAVQRTAENNTARDVAIGVSSFLDAALRIAGEFGGQSSKPEEDDDDGLVATA